MDHILEEKQQEKSTGRFTGKSQLPAHWIAALFEKMRLRYGSLWTKAIGDARTDIEAAMREWQGVLKNITGDEIKHGLDIWDSEFPPNVYQFRTACKSLRRSGAHKPYRALPKPRLDPEIARKAIEKMKLATRTVKVEKKQEDRPAEIDHRDYGDTRSVNDLMEISRQRG